MSSPSPSEVLPWPASDPAPPSLLGTITGLPYRSAELFFTPLNPTVYNFKNLLLRPATSSPIGKGSHAWNGYSLAGKYV